MGKLWERIKAQALYGVLRGLVSNAEKKRLRNAPIIKKGESVMRCPHCGQEIDFVVRFNQSTTNSAVE